MSLGYLPGAHEPDCPVFARIAELSPPWAASRRDEVIANRRKVFDGKGGFLLPRPGARGIWSGAAGR